MDEILYLFDSVQAWLVARGLKGQWGEVPLSSSPSQRERFASWLDAGDFYVVRDKVAIVATLVLTTQPPDYAKGACKGQPEGSYLEAFAVDRAYAGQGMGSTLLAWAEAQTLRRGLNVLRLDCWAENKALRAYYRRSGFEETAALVLGAWEGVLFEKELKAPT